MAGRRLSRPSTRPYSVLYVSYPACDLAVDAAGNLYLGLCAGGVQKFNASGSQVASFQSQYAAALNSSSAYARPLVDSLLQVSASGTVWTLDINNEQLVSASNVGLSNASVSVLPITSEGGSADFSIAPNSNNLWFVFPGVASAPVQQLSANGTVLRSWSPSTSPGLVDYALYGIFAAASGSVYVSGCYPATAFIFSGGHNYVDDAAAVVGCDIRRFSANGTLLQTFTPIRPSGQQTNVTRFLSMVVDSTGAVYALDNIYRNAYKWSSSGVQVLAAASTDLYNLAIAPSTNALYALTYDNPFAVVTVNRSTLLPASSFEISPNDESNDFTVALSPDSSIVYLVGSRPGVQAINATTGAVLGLLGSAYIVGAEWVATDKAGNLYVLDYIQSVVIKLSSNGTYLMTFSTNSTTQPSFFAPFAVAVNPVNGEVVVTDLFAPGLFIFAADGTFLRLLDTTPYFNPSAPTVESVPYGLAISSKGVIVYADLFHEEVVILTEQGNATSPTFLFNKGINFQGTYGSARAAHTAVHPLPPCPPLLYS